MNRKRYRHIYFDLDRTLWDFDANSENVLSALYTKYDLGRYYDAFDQFFSTYMKINTELWDLYRKGKMSKTVLSKQRFEDTFQSVGLMDEQLALNIGFEYIQASPYQKILYPGVHEVLSYLKERYGLYIITNGFKEVQYKKLNNSDLSKYFTKVFISEEIGYKKPHPEIFRYAITSANARKNESIMIGDDLEVDIQGAREFGIDQIFFNPEKSDHQVHNITFEVHSLFELKDIF